MAIATLPPPVEIDSETKRAVIDGLKKVLALFQAEGLVESGLTYQAVIADPVALSAFCDQVRSNRERLDAIVIAADGSGPVRDDQIRLVCGVTLAQIEQLLVRTCAKKVFETDRTFETITETITKKSLFGLVKKTETIERQSLDPVEDRKLRELLGYIAFGWQLPLLDAYRTHLSYQQIIEIGEDLIALPTAAKIEALSRFDPAMLKKVKAAVGADFGAILADRPQAIAGIAVWNRDMYEFYRKTLGDRAWTFFARDSAFFNVCAALDKSSAAILANLLCFISAESLQEMQRLNLDKMEVMAYALTTAFGKKLPQILSIPAFAKDILRKVVESLLHTNQDKDKLMTAFALTCKAMTPAVEDWLAANRPS
jgi:hypothetical protein